MTNQIAQSVAQALKHVDRPEISETFADSLERLTFDNGCCRFEFVVNRVNQPTPNAAPKGEKTTACRLVMPLASALALAQQINGLLSALQSQGIVKQMPQAPSTNTVN